MKTRRYLRYGLFALLFAPLFPSGCDADGVVGGDCRADLKSCDGFCVSVSNSREHCGACGKSCNPGVPCVGGVCGGLDGSAGSSDSSLDRSLDGQGDGQDDPSRDARSDRPDSDGNGGSAGSNPDGSNPDGNGGSAGSNPDGSNPDGSNPDGSVCLPPHDVPSHCGDCATQCVAPNRFCSPSDGGFACVPLCTPPLTECGNQCVDTNIDPEHCGRCFNVCPTGLCQGGMCVGANPGHIVLACSNYELVSANSPQTVVLANAVFLPLRSPVRMLGYQQYVNAPIKNRVDSLINSAALSRGRTFTMTAANSSAEVAANLSILAYEVFVVYDQPNAPTGTLGNIGSTLNLTLESFARAGGVIVVLDGGGGVSEMDLFMTNAGLLPVTGETPSNATQVFNRAPADAIGTNVLSPYLTQRETCTFTTSATPDASTVFVITDLAGPPLGRPVIVHRIQLP